MSRDGQLRRQSRKRWPTIFSVKQEDLKGFHAESKRYGVLYYPIVNMVEHTGTVEIMAKARDAKQINRIFERMGYPAPTQEEQAAKKARSRDPSENSFVERGTGARVSTGADMTQEVKRPSVRDKLDALKEATRRQDVSPTREIAKLAADRRPPTR